MIYRAVCADMKNSVEPREGGRRHITIVSRLYRPEASAALLRLGALVDGLRTAATS